MYLFDISELPSIEGKTELMYNDQDTGEQITGIIVGTEQVGPESVFVYVASPYEDENVNEENGIKYKDILVFDNYPNEMKDPTNDKSGIWVRDSMLARYGKIAGRVMK